MARLLPETAELLNYAEPDAAQTGMVMASDLMAGFVSRDWLEAGLENLHAVLADGSLTTADLKGPLNRASAKMWGFEYNRRFTPREFLEELRDAKGTRSDA